jgi:hypothetical protein
MKAVGATTAQSRTPQRRFRRSRFQEPFGLGSFGDVPYRAFELAIEIGANGKDVFGSTPALAAG